MQRTFRSNYSKAEESSIMGKSLDIQLKLYIEIKNIASKKQ